MNMRKIIAVLSAVLMLCAIVPMGAVSVSAAEEVAYLADFENGSIGGWKNDSGNLSVVSTSELPTANAACGSYVLKKVQPVGEYSFNEDRSGFAVEPNTDYTVSVDVLTTSNNWPIQAFVSTGTWITGQLGSVTVKCTSNQWTTLTFNFNSGENTKLYCSVKSQWENTTLYIDNFKVAKLDPYRELVKNGGFEDGTTSGWSIHETVTVEADAAHDGNYGAHLKDRGTWGGIMNQTFAVEAGKTYEVTATATLIPVPTTYTVTWVDEDGTVLETDENVASGTTPEYNGEAPVKAADAQYTYTFAGWTPEVTEVTGDVTYTATYTATLNKYTVKFVNEDGTELQSSEVAYGETPAYTGETPTKAATAEYTYTFTGWTPAVVPVTGEATYTAEYEATKIETETYEAKLAALSVSYAAEVQLQLRFEIPEELQKDAGAYVQYTLNGETTTLTMEEVVGTVYGGYPTVVVGIPSGLMTYQVPVKMFKGTGEAVLLGDYMQEGYVGTEVSRSVQDYAKRIMEVGSEAQKKVVAAMLVYGGYAQPYFGLDKENPAYKILTDYGMTIPTLEDVTKDTIQQALTVTGSENGLKYTNQSAVLDSAMYLTTRFQLEAGASIEDYRFELTYIDANANFATKTEEVTARAGQGMYAGLYEVDTYEIPAAFWDYEYELKVTRISDGATSVVKSSVIAWVDRILEKSSNADQIKMAKAMYYYNQAANEFFGM